MSYKVRCGTFFKYLCNTTEKIGKRAIYFLFSKKSNRRRRRRRRREHIGTISNTTIRKYIYPKDKYLIVHSSNLNQCEYVLAILKGERLKDDNMIKSSGEMIWRKN